MYIVNSQQEYTLIEKKSKFITRIIPVITEDEAEQVVINIKKKEKGARHNCYAYRIFSNGSIIERKNDDGEPGGTAGAPMLSVLTGNDLINVIAITTRYFGGIKLGTGGLVAAYKRGVVEVLKQTSIIPFILRNKYEFKFKIIDIKYAEYIIDKNNINVINKTFEDVVTFEILLSEEERKTIENFISEKQLKVVRL